MSAFFGLAGSPTEWHGAKVLCSTYPGDPYGAAILPEHFRREKCDLIITLCDIWVLDPLGLRGLPVAHWLPVDCDPLSALDEACLKGSGAVPIAMSRYGEAKLREAGFDPLFVPHSLHPAFREYAPEREKAREQLGVTSNFVVGINAQNKDPYRKGMAETLEGFARFWRRHPDAVLLVHGLIDEPGSVSLQALVSRLDLGEAVRFVDQYVYLTGQVPREHLVSWYAALDLFSGCAYGEGFGLPVLEAQAMGVPVVVTDASAMTELCAAGWRVPGERFWNVTHRSWWCKPSITGIATAYEEAYRLRAAGSPVWAELGARGRVFGDSFAPADILAGCWEPALKTLDEYFASREALPPVPEDARRIADPLTQPAAGAA